MALRETDGSQQAPAILSDIPGCEAPRAKERGIGILCAHAACGEIGDHSHEELQICVLFTPAECVFSWRDSRGRLRTLRVRGPAVVMIAPRHVHACRWEKAAGALILYLNPSDYPNLWRKSMGLVTAASPVALRDRMLWQFAGMLRDICAAPAASHQSLQYMVAESLATRASEVIKRDRSEVERSLTDALLTKVEEFVATQLAYDIHIDDLARCAGYSVPHFSVLFKAAKGITPRAFIFECRMLRAETLLRTGNYLIGEVAKLVGYLDQGRFSELFRNHFGCAAQLVIQQARIDSSDRRKIS